MWDLTRTSLTEAEITQEKSSNRSELQNSEINSEEEPAFGLGGFSSLMTNASKKIMEFTVRQKRNPIPQ